MPSTHATAMPTPLNIPIAYHVSSPATKVHLVGTRKSTRAETIAYLQDQLPELRREKPADFTFHILWPNNNTNQAERHLLASDAWSITLAGNRDINDVWVTFTRKGTGAAKPATTTTKAAAGKKAQGRGKPNAVVCPANPPTEESSSDSSDDSSSSEEDAEEKQEARPPATNVKKEEPTGVKRGSPGIPSGIAKKVKKEVLTAPWAPRSLAPVCPRLEE